MARSFTWYTQFQLRPGAELESRIGLEAFERRVHEQRSRQLTEQVERVGGAPSVSIHVVRAAPTKAILDLSALFAPDLVVMGTVSRGRARSRLVGSTALRLLSRFDCSLLTVKPDDFVCRLRNGEPAQ